MLHVVERKSAEEWVADPSLVDVSAGRLGHNLHGRRQRVEQHRAAVLGDVEITSDRAFDVILDFDMDGTLSPGDIAMGPGDDWPGITVMGNLHEAGPHDVESFTYSGGAGLTKSSTCQKTSKN